MQMRLEEYLEEFGTTIPKLARKANLSAITVRDVVNQKRDPQLSTALSLEAATKGQVTCRDMLPSRLLEQILSPSKAEGKQKTLKKGLQSKKSKDKKHNKK